MQRVCPAWCIRSDEGSGQGTWAAPRIGNGPHLDGLSARDQRHHDPLLPAAFAPRTGPLAAGVMLASGQDLPGRVDVVGHLRDQRLDAVELDLPTQSLGKVTVTSTP